MQKSLHRCFIKVLRFPRAVSAVLLFAWASGATADPAFYQAHNPSSEKQSYAAAYAAAYAEILDTDSLSLANHIASSGEGFDKHRLSDGRKLVGWKLSEKLYFGRAKKEGATVALVWEQTAAQRVSVSTDGFKFTRRLH